MTTDDNKRRVQIIDGKTGEVRMSEPMPVHTPHALTGDTPPTPPAPPEAVPQATQPTDPAPAPATEAAPERMASPQTAGKSDSSGKSEKPAKNPRPKLEIETLEQFIEYAYRRRGQPLNLETKVQQAIAQQPRLDEAAIGRLLKAVNVDSLLAVPRQILLSSREVHGLPELRGALTEFVSMVMLRQAVFTPEGVQAAVRNLPGALSPADALAAVAAYTPAEVQGQEPLKPSELKELRRNAAHLLATWLAVHRSLGLEEVAGLLFVSLWEPAARELDDDTDRLRALTEVDDAAGAGLAAQRYRQLAAVARAAQDQALREAAALRHRAVEQEAQLDQVRGELETRVGELEALRSSSEQELATLRAAHSAGRMHQGHELEQLRGRLARRLEESLELLDVGLAALRNRTPNIEVMVERAEQVRDDLRSELNSLREG